MWTGLKFHLEVIRAYDKPATKGIAVHKSSAEDVLANQLKYLISIIDQAEQNTAEGVVTHAQKAIKPAEMNLVTLGSQPIDSTCSFATALQSTPAHLVLPLVSVCAALCGGRWWA